MKKLVFLGLILTAFSFAVSAQEASGESMRRHRSEEAYRNGELSHQEMRRLHNDHSRFEREKRSDFRDSRMSRRERHRMHRHERREMRRHRHHHHRGY